MTLCIAESASCQFAACRWVESTSRFHPLPGNRSESSRSHSEVLAHLQGGHRAPQSNTPGNGPLVCTNAVATRVSDKTNRTYPLWSAEIARRVLRHPATGDNRDRRSLCLPRAYRTPAINLSSVCESSASSKQPTTKSGEPSEDHPTLENRLIIPLNCRVLSIGEFNHISNGRLAERLVMFRHRSNRTCRSKGLN